MCSGALLHLKDFLNLFLALMSLIPSFEDILVDSVHNCSLLNDHEGHLLIDISQVIHLIEDLRYLLISVGKLAGNLLQLLTRLVSCKVVLESILTIHVLHFGDVVFFNILQATSKVLQFRNVALLNIFYYFNFCLRVITLGLHLTEL